MSLNKNLSKYSIRCSSENKIVYTWNETSPQVCPNNTNHLIDLNSIKIIDTIIQNSVNIIQSNGQTGNNYRVESKKITIPANSTLDSDYTWNYPISVMTINWYASTEHIGDVINGFMAPYTTIGVITNNITTGDTLIHVSPDVIIYIKVGYEVNITNEVSNIIMGEVIEIDKINNTLILSIAASENINAPAYLQMTIHNIYNINLVPCVINLAAKHIESSFLPKNTVARLEYTNNSNIEKTFIFLIEYIY
jgi:hypothetical protein